ncbi:unnamed protein product [Spirodela intermedia]|uniref:RRM domain-containing protein n=2 Tax=Spirodela intermedia TaxID=51605 RepID=A0A7I8L1D1_SPIIN|nr:unnamed protein product [Spirodela intermedia]CAA6667012.1 unnamed protein product [Spirodela intermedia]CAA7403823.1 unnamed protein product [Spirodela intermedia]
MPPRVANKASGGTSGPGRRMVSSTGKGKAKAAADKVAEEIPVVDLEEVKTLVDVVESVLEPEPEANGSIGIFPGENVKEVYIEEDNCERLDLDDNDIEFDPEEEPDMEYDEKRIENDDEQEEGDRVEEGGGDIDDDEEERDMIEEIDSDGGNIEGEEDDENVEDEHEDAVEEQEQHDLVAERRKRKEFEIFVGGLDKDSTEEDLKKVFSVVGKVVEVRLMKNPQTKKNKGFAFLRFATVEQAKRAVAELKNPVINGKQCGVSPSQDNDTLFLGNICRTWTKEHLKDKLKQYGVENIDDLTLVEDSNNEGNNRGFAFLEFASRTDAMDAYRRLQKQDVAFGVDRNAKVSFADSFIEPDDEIMAQVKTVFVDGLPAAWDEERIRDYLKKFGQIERVELARNMPAAKRKDFGFVTFETHDSAVKCAEAINNAELGEGDKKVKVRARLSRPRRRGRGYHGFQGDLRYGRWPPRGGRFSWTRPMPHRIPGNVLRPGHGAFTRGRGAFRGGRGLRRPIDVRDRRSVMEAAERDGHFPPIERSYDRRLPSNPYPRSSSKGDFIRHEVPPRRKAAADYDSRVPEGRRSSYQDDYFSRGPSDYTGVRSSSSTAVRQSYGDEGYGRRFEKLPPTYREAHSRDYDSISGSKRSYSMIDDAPPHYGDVGIRQSRPRLDYGISGSSAHYDEYGERLGRSDMGYGRGSRSSLSTQEPHSPYGSNRRGRGYPRGLSSNGGGMYSSYSSGSYLSRSDVGGGSYTSLYSNRGLGGSGYPGGSGSGSYY